MGGGGDKEFNSQHTKCKDQLVQGDNQDHH